MNVVCLIGRITRDLELRYTQSNMAMCKFSVAVNRKTKDKEADFINCVAFGKTAEFLNSYFGKGRAIAITGHIQTGNYTNKDGQKVYTTDVICDSLDFADSKRDNEAAPTAHAQQPAQPSAQQPGGEGFYAMNEDADDLPF